MKKIAICLYGQPRNYKEGYKNIFNLMDLNKNIHFDIFFHTWYEKNGGYYESSNYREIDRNELLMKDNVMEDLVMLYNPKKCMHEPPKQFDISHIQKSCMTIHLSEKEKGNIHNVVSNIYSKYKSCEQMMNYVQETKEEYDLAISIRFDFMNPLNLDLNMFNANKYSTTFSIRIHINDCIVACNYAYFIIYSSAYLNIDAIINNSDIQQMSYAIMNEFKFVPECFVTCNLIRQFGMQTANLIENRRDIPNFC